MICLPEASLNPFSCRLPTQLKENPARLPPSTTIDSLYTIIRSGLWRLWYKLCSEGRHRLFTEFFPLLHDAKLECLGPQRDIDSYYLVYLGTRESARGQGLARRLLCHTLHRADAEGKAAYLESSNAANLGFYERLGFQTLKRIDLTRGPALVSMDCMLREPGARRIPGPSANPAAGVKKGQSSREANEVGVEKKFVLSDPANGKSVTAARVKVEVTSRNKSIVGAEEKTGLVPLTPVNTMGAALGF